MEHSARQDHDHHAGGGSSVGWNCLGGNARSDTGRWVVGGVDARGVSFESSTEYRGWYYYYYYY